jgi:hypothetical protein
VPFGIVTWTPGIVRSRSTMTLRWFSRVRRSDSIEVWTPESAPIAAHWETVTGPEVWWPWMFVIASTTSRFPRAQPMRKPVMAYIFETPWTTTRRDCSTGSFAKSYGLGAFWPSKTSRL